MTDARSFPISRRTAEPAVPIRFQSGYSLVASEIERGLGILRRRWQILAIALAVALCLGLGYALSARKLFTSDAQVLLTASGRSVSDPFQPATRAAGDEELKILNQIEILRSERLLRLVVIDLGLQNDTTFTDAGGGGIGSVRKAIRALLSDDAAAGKADSDEERLDEAVATLSDLLRVERIGRTAVVKISITTTGPNQAARLAQAVAETYVEDQLQSKYAESRRAAEWLRHNITELKRQSQDADLAVQRFRTENGLIQTDDQLLSDRQLTELSSQLVDIRAQRVNAQARLERVESILASKNMDAIVTDALQHPIITSLREKYLDTERRRTDIGQKLAADHEIVVNLTNEMNEYKRLIFDELRRIAESYKSDASVAEGREKLLEAAMRAKTAESLIANQTSVRLRELEQVSENLRDTLKSSLEQYQSLVKQQTYPLSEARITSNAAVPSAPSHPRRLFIVGFSLLLGGILGTIVLAVQEFGDRTFRTPGQIAADLGLELITGLPRLDTPTDAPAAGEGTAGTGRPADEPFSRRAVVPDGAGGKAHAAPRSMFAQSFVAIKLAVDALGKRSGPVVGVVSTDTGEGKTMVATNLALLLSAHGRKVLLIDADLYRAGASRSLRCAVVDGLASIDNGRRYGSILAIEPETQLVILPATGKGVEVASYELMSSQRVRDFIVWAKGYFDYVVIDFPPIGPTQDARVAQASVDAYLLVLEWGRSTRLDVRRILQREPRILEKCIGAVLNKVDLKIDATHGTDCACPQAKESYQAYYTNPVEARAAGGRAPHLGVATGPAAWSRHVTAWLRNKRSNYF